MSQFLFQTPAGYLYDYTKSKVLWLSLAAIFTTMLTVFTAIFATDYGANLHLMIFVKFMQGAVTSFIPPGLNSIAQGIVGADGMTSQVSINEMMNHLGTAVIVLIGSITGYILYPNLDWLFLASPVACAGVIYYLSQLKPDDIDHDAARGLLVKPSSSNRAEYVSPRGSIDVTESQETEQDAQQTLGNMPSFSFGWPNKTGLSAATTTTPKADTPFKMLQDPILLAFIVIVFLFNTSNGTVLPLVMQTLAIGGNRAGILMSGLCIIVSQVCIDYDLINVHVTILRPNLPFCFVIHRFSWF
jgi:MFS family permease